MTKVISWCDRVMFGALLLLVIFIPYSSAMIQVGLIAMMIGWQVKHFCMWKLNPQQGFVANYRLPHIPLQWPLILIGALILLTIPFSHAPALTLKKFFSRFLQNALLLYLVLELVNSPKRFFQVMLALLSTLVVVNTDVFIQYFRGESFIFGTQLLYGRVSGPMRHPNDLGTILVTVIPVVIALFVTRTTWIPFVLSERWKKGLSIVIAAVLVLLVIALGLTSSRGAWLAFGVTMITLGIILRKPLLLAGILSALVLFFLGFGVYCINTRTDISPTSGQQRQISNEVVSVEKVSAIQRLPDNQDVDVKAVEDNADRSVKERVTKSDKVFFNSSRRYEYWQTAFNVMKQFPLFGCGYNTYIQALKKLGFTPIEYPHNSLMQIAAELGLVGLVLHLWLFMSIALCAARALKIVLDQDVFYKLGIGISLGILAWFIHSLTDTAWVSLQPSILWWLFIGLLCSLAAIVKQMKVKQ